MEHANKGIADQNIDALEHADVDMPTAEHGGAGFGRLWR